MRRFPRPAGRGLFLAGLLTLAATPQAWAQSISVTAPGNNPDIGNVTVAVSGLTEFRVDTGGAVSVVPGGTGTRRTTGTVANTITVSCSNQGPNNQNNPCNSTKVAIRISPTTATGRAQAINDLVVAMGTAVLVADSTKYVGPNLEFVIQPVGRGSSRTFHLGLDLPISGGFGASGLAQSGYRVEAGFAPNLTASVTGNARATTRNPMLITKGADLSFGSVLRLAGQDGTVTVDATTGGWSTSNPAGILLRPGLATSRATYSIQGEGGQVLSVNVPPTFVMNGPNGGLTVTTTKTIGGTVTLPNAAGQAGSTEFGVGGSFPISGTLAPGSYSGTFNVTFTWN